ncbi:MAG: methyltransferase domain-containing protein [Phycisphaeraceae bacterium]|nr:methyltransferase domain-containing protein [Phycisphaeraceae bacterium]
MDARPQEVAARLIRICGAGRTLVVGWPGLAEALWRVGVDAVVLSPDEEHPVGINPSRLIAGTVGDLPGLAGRFDHVVVAGGLEDMSESDGLTQTLHALATLATRSVVLMIKPDAQRARAWWEARMFACGLRRHPLTQRWTYFTSLDVDRGLLTLIGEPIPVDAFAAFPQGRIKDESGAEHADALRECGREADAQIARYLIAAEMVRTGDVVLDLACGAGHGAWMIASGSEAARVIGVDSSRDAVRYALSNFRRERAPLEFRAVDRPQDLSSLADASVDFISVISPRAVSLLDSPLMKELSRVLSPGGRVLLCGHGAGAATAAGWDWLAPGLGEGFIPERMWRQVAGTTPGFEHLDRALREVPVELGEHGVPSAQAAGPAEWWIVAAMKSPVGAGKHGYRETLFPDYSHLEGFDLSAFARDYDNPWLFRSMVCIGPRMGHDAQRVRMARHVLASARPGSPDHGAAVCVLAYASLAGNPDGMRESLRLIDEYEPLADGSPHAWRWRISNRYAAAKVKLAMGDRAGARADFVACGGMDVLRFSPLLATKTVDAWCQAGVISLLDGDTAAARAAWVKGLEECRRVVVAPWTNVWGLPQQPHPYSMHELSQVIDAGSLCASWMNACERAAWQPGTAWMLATRQTFADRERLSSQRAAYISSLEAWCDELKHAADWHQGQSQAWEKNAASLVSQVEELRAWNAQLTSAAEWHTQERARLEASLAAAHTALAGQTEWIKGLEEGKAWHESQAKTWEEHARVASEQLCNVRATLDEVCSERETLRADLARAQAELSRAAEERHALRTLVDEQHKREEALSRTLAQAEQTAAELNQALEQATGLCRQREQELAAQHERAAWLESQCRSLGAHASSLEEARAWFESQRDTWESIARRGQEANRALAQREETLVQSLRTAEAEMASLRAELARVRSLRIHQFAWERWRGGRSPVQADEGRAG